MNSSKIAGKYVIEAVAMGTSANGVRGLLTLFSDLPVDFALPLVGAAFARNRDSELAEILQHRLPIRVREAADKESIAPDTLYCAGPGYHLSAAMERTFSLPGEAPAHYLRPSIDLLMQSAVDAYGASLAGRLLTGANFDGATGLAKISE